MFGLANHDDELWYFLLSVNRALNNDLVHMFSVIDDCSMLPSGAMREEIWSEWFILSKVKQHLIQFRAFVYGIMSVLFYTCHYLNICWTCFASARVAFLPSMLTSILWIIRFNFAFLLMYNIKGVLKYPYKLHHSMQFHFLFIFIEIRSTVIKLLS